jgi:hypothetical protein
VQRLLLWHTVKTAKKESPKSGEGQFLMLKNYAKLEELFEE